MHYLDQVVCLLAPNEEDIEYLFMVFRNACGQKKVRCDAIQIALKHVSYLGTEYRAVSFNVSSYDCHNKVGKVVRRIFKRLYKSRGKSHSLMVLIRDVEDPIPFDKVLSRSDRDKIMSLKKKPPI